MAEQRLIDANTVGNGMVFEWQKELVKEEVCKAPTIDPESLPIVQQLRAELANCKQELRQIKYCYDIAKNGEKQFRKQNDEITAAWAECEKKLKQVTAERDAAVADMQALMWYSGDGCEICKHKIVEQCHPYTRLGCKLNGECNPKWCGVEDKND